MLTLAATLRLLATSVVLTATAALLTTAPAPAGAVAAVTAPPAVGSCHDLTLAESTALADPDPATSCYRTHTSRTFLVPTVPEGTSMGDRAALTRLATQRCGPAYARATSRSAFARAMSAYYYVVFRPTDEQVADGARWLRCDLVLAGGGALAPLPRRCTPALGTAPHPDSEARCQLGAPGDYALTVCTRAHDYRARGTFSVRSDYPDYRQRAALGKSRCSRLAGNRWLLSSPTRAQYDAGDRVFVCSTRTSR